MNFLESLIDIFRYEFIRIHLTANFRKNLACSLLKISSGTKEY